MALAPFGIAVGDCIGLIRHRRFPLAALRSTGYVALYQRRYLSLEQSGAGCTTQTRRELRRERMDTIRIKLFVTLPIDKLDRLSMQRRAEEIGKSA